jgi:hypothetical protein
LEVKAVGREVRSALRRNSTFRERKEDDRINPIDSGDQWIGTGRRWSWFRWWENSWEKLSCKWELIWKSKIKSFLMCAGNQGARWASLNPS